MPTSHVSRAFEEVYGNADWAFFSSNLTNVRTVDSFVFRSIGDSAVLVAILPQHEESECVFSELTFRRYFSVCFNGCLYK